MPIVAPVIRKILMIAPRVAPIVRSTAIARALSCTSMIMPEMMLSAATSTIRDKIANITFASTAEHVDQAPVVLPPVGVDHRTLLGGRDARAHGVDSVGIVEIDLDHVDQRRRG